MSANIDNINNANNGSVIENGMSINKMGKRKDKGMEIKDKFGKLDAVNANSLDVFIGGLWRIEGLGNLIKSMEISIVAAKNSNVSAKGSKSVTKSVIMITERWDVSVNSGTQVLITTNLNNLALISPPFIFSQLDTCMGISIPASLLNFHYRSDFIISFGHTSKAISGP